MKPLEMLSTLPRWAKATPDAVLDSPAFAMPCRLGDESVFLRPAAVEPSESGMIALSVTFGDEPHTLRIARSPRFHDLDKLWDSRADVPEPILLALVERELGPFFQLLENAVRKQLRLEGIPRRGAAGAEALRESNSDSSDTGANVRHWRIASVSRRIGKSEFLLLCVSASSRENEIVFTLTRTQTVVSALGSLRNLDLAHETIRSQTLAAEVEYAAFQLPEADIASLAPGDALLLPEIGTVPPRLVADGRFVVDENGVAPYMEDEMCRVRGAERRMVSLGELFDASGGSQFTATGNEADATSASLPGSMNRVPPANAQLRLVRNGKVVAMGRIDRLGDQPAFIVEAKE